VSRRRCARGQICSSCAVGETPTAARETHALPQRQTFPTSVFRSLGYCAKHGGSSLIARLAVRPKETVAATYGRRRRPQAAATADPCTAQTHTRNNTFENRVFRLLHRGGRSRSPGLLLRPRNPRRGGLCCLRSLLPQPCSGPPPFLAQYQALGKVCQNFPSLGKLRRWPGGRLNWCRIRNPSRCDSVLALDRTWV